MSREELDRIIEQGNELMEQNGSAGVAREEVPEAHGDEEGIRRVEEPRTAQRWYGVEKRGDEPPPMYTP